MRFFFIKTQRFIKRNVNFKDCLFHPPPPLHQSLARYICRQKPKKWGKMTERFTWAQLSVCQLHCERWERKLKTFHDVADVAFQNSFILLTTFMQVFVPASVVKNSKDI